LAAQLSEVRHLLSKRLYVRPSVCPSVCLSVTLLGHACWVTLSQ